MKPVIGLSSNYVPPGDPRCPSQSGAYYMNRSYVALLRQAGTLPINFPHATEREDLAQLLDRVDGLLLTGGRDLDPAAYGEEPHAANDPVDPERTASDLALARLAVERRYPILAVCLGLQTLNVAFGGSLWQDLSSQHPSEVTHRRPLAEHARLAHTVGIVEGSLLHRSVGRTQLEVNSTHHQGVRDIGPRLVPTAVAPDGIVEALELPALPFCLGVQWHPESLAPEHPPHQALFDAFVAAVRRHAAERSSGDAARGRETG
jgi:putative glutamine amidotransferase